MLAANGAFRAENVPFPAANGPFDAGNDPLPTRNGAFPLVNEAFLLGNASFLAANAAFDAGGNVSLPSGNGVFRAGSEALPVSNEPVPAGNASSPLLSAPFHQADEAVEEVNGIVRAGRVFFAWPGSLLNALAMLQDFKSKRIREIEILFPERMRLNPAVYGPPQAHQFRLYLNDILKPIKNYSKVNVAFLVLHSLCIGAEEEELPASIFGSYYFGKSLREFYSICSIHSMRISGF